MGEYLDEEWYIKLSREYIEKYGAVPPPWIYGPTFHPYSIGWRMGSGETYMMVLSEWLEQQNFSQEQRIAYMKKYPAPPRWFQWVAQFIWQLDDLETDDFDFTPYFQQLEQLGFEGVADFEKDFNSDQWE